MPLLRALYRRNNHGNLTLLSAFLAWPSGKMPGKSCLGAISITPRVPGWSGGSPWPQRNLGFPEAPDLARPAGRSGPPKNKISTGAELLLAIGYYAAAG